MQNQDTLKEQPSFLIYDAAAGSGKTFTLVKEYLKKVLTSSQNDYYKHLLAITFTNKAVAEMKQRIVDSLVTFGLETSPAQPPPMMELIAQEIGLSLSEIQARSEGILKSLLHNYAAFSVETIDSFNHRLIRTFARDLKLATNFEVSLDVAELLAEAVDLLLSRAGENEAVTQALLDFALEKADDDRSWDISRDIARAAQLLYDENDAGHASVLKEKGLDDFLEFKKHLLRKKKKLEKEIKDIATQTLQAIEERGLEFSDFSGGYLPKHFQNLSIGRFDINFGAKWQESMGEKPLYPGRVSSETAAVIDGLVPRLIDDFQETKTMVSQVLLMENILRNLNPLSVINLVNKELETIKLEKNLLPISEFNALINKEIKNQPAPFIYERLGEKYRHFFIDEFQDTSRLQWENLIPLIDNALSQQINTKNGSLLLVGDAKQSIYRWRGGLPEQFIGLCNETNPFPAQEKYKEALPKNFRSCREIVNFNNRFFSFIAPYFASTIHTELYKTGNQQECNSKDGGYIKIEFIEKQKKAEKDETYAQMVYETIEQLKGKGYQEADICILTRFTADGISLGAYLMERGVAVMSSQTLLLQASPVVQLLVMALRLCVYPEDAEARIHLLNLLHDHLQLEEEKDTYFTKFLHTSEEIFCQRLGDYGLDFNLSRMRSVSTYEALEYCIEKFHIAEGADAYLFGFMDLVYEFGQQPRADKLSFLDHWETKRESASIPAGEGTNAVQLMTIHKAKGLEFPVVLFPYADISLRDGKRDKLWYPLEDNGLGFAEAQISYKAEIENYGPTGQALYQEHRSELELDSINLLYVSLTRAVEKLYIFSEMPTQPKDGVPSTYNHLFMEFLKKEGKWDTGQMVYEFGEDSERIDRPKEIPPQTSPTYLSSHPQEHGLKLVSAEPAAWSEETAAAITAGNLLHDTMAQIHSAGDVASVLGELQARGIVPESEFSLLQQTVQKITTHPQLAALFSENCTIYNERSILGSDHRVLRPDRINISPEGAAIILDYKTGSAKEWHEAQITEYADALAQMGLTVSEKMLIYCNEGQIVINKV